MPEFVWNEYDFLECLGVIPTIEEYEISHTYTVERNGLILSLFIRQYDREISFTISRQNAKGYILYIRLNDCPGARLVKYKTDMECLEFAPAKCFGSRYDGQSAITMGIRLSVDPDIMIEIY
jgi:hypothetical protein